MNFNPASEGVTMTAKTTYVAVAPDGTTHIRNSSRSYTHAVLTNDCYGTPSAWGIVGFSGSLDLATKLHAKNAPFFASRGADTVIVAVK